MQYAFFAYKTSKERKKRRAGSKNKEKVKNISLPSDTEKLTEYLAAKTTKLTIIPLNLLFVLLRNSRYIEINQRTSDYKDSPNYWQVFGSVLTRLHESDRKVGELADNAFEFAPRMRKLFCLEDLASERYSSPANLSCRSYGIKTNGKVEEHELDPIPIRPFRITRYYNQNPREWMQSFKEHHAKIVEGFMGIKGFAAPASWNID